MAYIYEGKTTTEAIEKGLKELKVSKSQVEIKVLESEDKRSFFSILTPRVVKVELILKNKEKEDNDNVSKKSVKKEPSEKSVEIAMSAVESFLKKFVSKLPGTEFTYNVRLDDNKNILVDMDSADRGYLIGYRGEVLNAFQLILNSVSNRASKEKTRIILNISDYREKREKSLEELADKISKTVIRTGKAITLEPMMAYERKIIHNRLQSSNKVKTYSIGEEPYRKVVISKK